MTGEPSDVKQVVAICALGTLAVVAPSLQAAKRDETRHDHDHREFCLLARTAPVPAETNKAQIYSGFGVLIRDKALGQNLYTETFENLD